VQHTHDSDRIVQQALAEHDNVQYLVHVDLLKDRQHRHRVDRADQRREQEHVEDGRLAAEYAALPQQPQRHPCGATETERSG